MAEFQIGGKPLFTQTGTDNPVMDSGVTFPAGHVIQTITKTDTVTATESSGNTVERSSTFFDQDITAKGNNSKFIINAFIGKTYAQNGSGLGKVTLVRSLDSTETYLNALNPSNQWGGIAVGVYPDYNPQSYCWVDENSSCSVGDVLNYVIKFVRYTSSGDSFYFIDGSNNGSYCSYVIQEISA